MPRRSLRCPECGYCPRGEAYKQLKEEEAGLRLRVLDDVPALGIEELDFFEVLGADEGNVICPRCACKFAVTL
ncbi:MAG: hypothetical protein ACXABY_26795 [Candidatus Thorarchaeota archaeon]|jgi:hypothetical protein